MEELQQQIEDLKILITQQVINKSPSNKVDNVELGQRINESLDLIVTAANIGSSSAQVYKIQKTNITEAQVLNMNTTPILVITGEENKYKFPVTMLIKREEGTPYTLAVNSMSLVNEFGITMQTNVNVNPIINGNSGEMFTTVTSTGNITGSSLINQDYKLSFPTSNPTGGTGGLEVWVTYLEITI